MLQALEGKRVGLALPRRLAVLGLLAVGGAVAPLVVRARMKAAQRPALVEVGRLDVRGAEFGAVYEDGKLVGVLEGVARL